MFKMEVKLSEGFDENTGEFVEETQTVYFEHSLLSVAKWEEKYEKPFLVDNDEKTPDEVLDYIDMMVVENNVEGDLLPKLSQKNITELQEYISKKATATWFRETNKKSRSSEVVTSELIYYWMFSYKIPKECETWHLNRLLTLIRVFGAKNEKPKKMSGSEISARNRSLNEQRKAQLATKG